MLDRKLIDPIVGTWRVHDRINLHLPRRISERGLAAVPLESRGRNVAQVFAHRHKVRVAWLPYNGRELVRAVPRVANGASFTRAKLKAALAASGETVARLLERATEGAVRIRAFKHQPVRWLAYLVSHDSHHRGQMAWALTQRGMRLPDDVAIRGLCHMWYWGRR